MKKYSYITSEVPTTKELENIQEVRKRVLLVIKTRWALLGVFLPYSLYTAFFYSLEGTSDISSFPKRVPIVLFFVAVAYNGLLHNYYRWFSNIRHLNLIQLLLDLIFVTIIVHFSGGAISWFWAIYFVLILEASFLGESVYDAWIVGFFALLFYGVLLGIEFYGVIPPVKVQFENKFLQQNYQYVMIKWAWVSMVCVLVSIIGSFMMKGMRKQEQTLKQMIITDTLTGLYNRHYFHIRLNSEIQRAKR